MNNKKQTQFLLVLVPPILCNQRTGGAEESFRPDTVLKLSVRRESPSRLTRGVPFSQPRTIPLRSYTKCLGFSLRSLLSQTALRCCLFRTRLPDWVHIVHTASVQKSATFTRARQLGLSKLPLEYKNIVFVIFSQPSNTPRLLSFM